jgi:hypothetical protein
MGRGTSGENARSLPGFEQGLEARIAAERIEIGVLLSPDFVQ